MRGVQHPTLKPGVLRGFTETQALHPEFHYIESPTVFVQIVSVRDVGGFHGCLVLTLREGRNTQIQRTPWKAPSP